MNLDYIIKRFLCFVLIALLFSCKDPLKMPDTTKQNNNLGNNSTNNSSENKNPGSSHNAETANNLEEALLISHQLTKGNISASAAAKKLAIGKKGKLDIKSIQIISYNDKLGIFKVKMSGNYDGKDFADKIIEYNGFVYPLHEKFIQSVVTKELNIDSAIEDNLTIDSYVEKVNAGEITPFKDLSFLLSDGEILDRTYLETHGLILKTEPTKKANAGGTFSLKIKPRIYYAVKEVNEAERLEPNSDISFHLLKSQFIWSEYFSKEDVFKFVMKKLKALNDEGKFFKIDTHEFASFYWAGIRSLRTSVPNDLLSQEAKELIETYKHKYKNPPNGFHNMDFDLGIGYLDNGLSANDYNGTLSVNFAVAKTEDLVAKTNLRVLETLNTDDYEDKYLSIPDETALRRKDHLFYHLIPKPALSDENKKKWEKLAFESRKILLVESGEVKKRENPFKPEWFTFSPCGYNSLEDALGCGQYATSKTRNGKYIYIEYIYASKKAGSKKYTISIKLLGKDSEMTMEESPY